MEEKTIQAIPILPFALMMACISAVIGLIIGIFYAVTFGAIFAAISSAVPGEIDLTGFGILFGAAAIIIWPIVMFVIGLVEGVIVAAIYNFLAPRIGGVKLRFKEDRQLPPP